MSQTTKASRRTLVFQPIPAEYLDQVRASGLDEAGNTVTVRAEAGRRQSAALLPARQPSGGTGPADCLHPAGHRWRVRRARTVFVHAEPCAGYPDGGDYPAGLAHRKQVVRAYDREGNMGDGALVDDGEQAHTVIAELLSRRDVAIVHARNVVAGCYNVSVVAAEATGTGG